MFRVIFKTVVLASLFFQVAFAEKINSCQWYFSTFKERFEIVNSVAERSFAKKVRKSVKTKRGDIVAYDFIPGSLAKDPIVIEGGLWYKIQYFDLFNRLVTQQTLIKDVLASDEKLIGDSIQKLVAEGHPIVIISRATQPESIATSLAEGVQPSFARRDGVSKTVTLDDHAQDASDIIDSLRLHKQIGAKKQIQLISLSYGIATAVHTAAKMNDQIAHKHLMAPLSKAGDNFPKETAMQEQLIDGIRRMYALWKLNPMTAAIADIQMNIAIDQVYNSASKKYSSDLIDNAFKNDPQLLVYEKQFPGIKEIFKKGLQNDMDAARPDRFSLDDPKYVAYLKNSTIYLAGDEEPARLKSQIAAYIKIKQQLGEEAPNLVIMDDAQHAITATAVPQTSQMVTTIIGTPALQKSTGTVFYMHRGDPSSKINVLNDKTFALIHEEINAQSIGQGIPSVLEVFYFNPIFKSRLEFHSNAIVDLTAALDGPKPMPPDFKENPMRPFEKAQYMNLTPEQKKTIQPEIDKQNQMLTMLGAIAQKANNIVQSMNGKQ